MTAFVTPAPATTDPTRTVPRVPSGDELDRLLAQALAGLGPERLWVNPDCGLKTRGWSEVDASLAELVAAAERARAASAG